MAAYLPTILLFLLFSSISLALAIHRPTWLLAGTLLMLLVHQFMMRFFTFGLELNDQLLLGISTWKESVLVALLFIGVVKKSRRQVLMNWLVNNRLVGFGLAAWFFIAALHTLLSPNPTASIFALRDYCEPILFLPILLMYWPNRTELGILLRSWLILGFLIALLGIWQAVSWDQEVYRQLGLGELDLSQAGMPTGGLPIFNGRRPPATLTGPNEFALHMVLMSLASVLSILQGGVFLNWSTLLAAIFGAAALVTVSRSGLLAMAISMVIVGWKHTRGRAKQWLSTRRLLILCGFASLFSILLWYIGVIPYFLETIRSLGNQYHIRDTLDAISFLVKNPAGVGMGLVGPRQGFGFPPIAEFHVEGSLFQIAMEMGVWGLAAFLAFISISLHRVWQAWQTVTDPLLEVLCGTAFAGWIGALVAFTFLPLMQALPLMAWLWFLLGIGLSANQLETAWHKTEGS